MALTAVLMVLVVNEISSGEGWYKGVIKGLVLAAFLIYSAYTAPGRTFVLCLMGLCALLASELARISDKRENARKNLAVLDERECERQARNNRRCLRLLPKRSIKRRAA